MQSGTSYQVFSGWGKNPISFPGTFFTFTPKTFRPKVLITFLVNYRKIQFFIPLLHNRPKNQLKIEKYVHTFYISFSHLKIQGGKSSNDFDIFLQIFFVKISGGEMFRYNYRYTQNHPKNDLLSITLKKFFSPKIGGCPLPPPNDALACNGLDSVNQTSFGFDF